MTLALRIATLCSCLIFLSITGCQAPKLLWHLNKPVPTPEPAEIRDVYVLVLVLDGGRADYIYDKTRSGELANFKRYVWDRGSYVEHAVATFPSVTSSGHQALITGLLPGRGEMPGLTWLDRSSVSVKRLMGYDGFYVSDELMAVRKREAVRRLFERPPNIWDDLHGHNGTAIYEAFHMNIEDRYPVLPWAAKAGVWYRNGKYLELDDDAGNAVVERYRRPVAEIPRLVIATFMGQDAVQHWHRTGSPEHLEAMQNEDAHVGRAVAAMKKAGIWDKTYILLVADHGSHETGTVFNVPKHLKTIGLRPLGLVAKKPNAYVSSLGIASAHIYLAHSADWRDRVPYDEVVKFPVKDGGSRGSSSGTVNVIEELTKPDAIDLVMARESQDVLHIFAKANKHAIVTRRSFSGEEWYTYSVPDGAADPLGYHGDAKTRAWVNDGKFHTGDEWALQSRETRYPDALVMAHQIFDSERAGDVIITATRGYHLRPRQTKYVQSHGGLTYEDLLVPLIISGPDIKREPVPFARLVDVYPTLARIFGRPLAEGIDGRPLDSILEFVPEEEKLRPRHQPRPTDGANEFFKRLSSLEELLENGVNGRPHINPEAAAMFGELRSMDFVEFRKQLSAETTRAIVLRSEITTRMAELEREVRALEKRIRWYGRDSYNDKLDPERKKLKKKREQVYILDRQTQRLTYVIGRGEALDRIQTLLLLADDFDQLVDMYAAATSPKGRVAAPQR